MISRRAIIFLLGVTLVVVLPSSTVFSQVTVSTSSSSSVTVLLSPQWRSLTPQQRIEIREIEFFAFAQTYAAAHGYRFGGGAENDFRFAAQQAARDIEEMPLVVQQIKAQEAKDNIQKIILEMIVASGRIPGYIATHPGIIGEDTLSRVKNALCPIWPFC